MTPLRDPDMPRSYLYGLWNQEERIVPFGSEQLQYQKKSIYIDPARHEKMGYAVLSTFIHELCHVLYPTIRERDIVREEKIIFGRLSENQKRVLTKFLPK